uniref:Cytochrome c oxidase subunit 3 n=1 Tax=Rhynchocinetes durbanensis TaxID=516932 RepID=A0A109YIE1_9EUCA|nr:cytochrome c oxidase subunit 3 [Rhynchocinetes durbanensis]AMA20511.1 cytochrome c oxidase subunit 3 [Rhynchocinetes durbanensis]
MKNFPQHAFHLVDMSPWPLTGSISALMLTTGLIKWFHLNSSSLLILAFLTTSLTMFQWWRDITREGTFQGLHSSLVTKGLKWGMILFITSEVLFFFSFFWGFFHSSLSPAVELGGLWPPKGIQPFNAFSIPLLNTAILLSSGATITWAHHFFLESNYEESFDGLLCTVVLGFIFTLLQGFEYMEAPFSMADSVYGSVFFLATGFHGLHVIIGSIFLLVTLFRLYLFHFSALHHVGFEAAAWYWHFVDVVWIFLFISIYWWGS